MQQFKKIKVYKLKEGEKVIFPSVETWYIDLNFSGKKSADNIIGEVEDYFIEDGFITADILLYGKALEMMSSTGNGRDLIIGSLTPAISAKQISVNQIKLLTLSLCNNPNQDPEIKSIKQQQYERFSIKQ